MKIKQLGKTEIKVSEIAFGTVSLGMPYGIGVNGEQDMPSERDAIRLLQSALDQGIIFFDTARGYGCSEERLGKAFRQKRNEVVISTKCTHLYNEQQKLPTDIEIKRLIDQSFNTSLAALQTDYVDVYMLHDAGMEVLNNQAILKTLNDYKDAGITRALGVSTYTVEETRIAIESGVWDVIQLAYNLMDQRQGELFNLAAQNGIGIVVRSVLFKGILTDRGRNLHPELKAVEQHRKIYNELLSKKTPDLSDLAIKFVLSSKEVSSVLVGIDKLEYLESAVADVNYLDATAFRRAKQLAYPEPEFLNLPMWNRKGWLT